MGVLTAEQTGTQAHNVVQRVLIIVAYKLRTGSILLDVVKSGVVGGDIFGIKDFVSIKSFINFLSLIGSCSMSEACMSVKLSWLCCQ